MPSSHCLSVSVLTCECLHKLCVQFTLSRLEEAVVTASTKPLHKAGEGANMKCHCRYFTKYLLPKQENLIFIQIVMNMNRS